jgi:hypothetical protein
MKHQGLDLAGIIITYVFSVSIVAAMILSLGFELNSIVEIKFNVKVIYVIF